MIIKKKNKTSDTTSAVSAIPAPVQQSEAAMPQAVKPELPKFEKKLDVFELDNIDFSQRQERRRGDRRRGYRRIDDRNLISRAQEEADGIKEAAAKEGYREGLAKAQDVIEELRDKIRNFISGKKEVFEYIAPDILEISVDIAQKIIKKEVKEDPQIVLNTILDIMQNLSKEEPKITITVNPSVVDFVKSELPEHVSSMGIEAKVTITGNDEVQDGGCIITTSNGMVDASVDTQLQIITEALKGI